MDEQGSGKEKMHVHAQARQETISETIEPAACVKPAEERSMAPTTASNRDSIRDGHQPPQKQPAQLTQKQ